MFEQLNKEALLKLYPEYKKIYFGTNPDERRLVYLVGASSRTTLTLAKALVEVKLGYKLDSSEEVDHIDDDKHNDDIDNLQVLNSTENRIKNKRVKLKVCPCGRQFKPRRKTQEMCSVKCRYKYTTRNNQYTK